MLEGMRCTLFSLHFSSGQKLGYSMDRGTPVACFISFKTCSWVEQHYNKCSPRHGETFGMQTMPRPTMAESQFAMWSGLVWWDTVSPLLIKATLANHGCLYTCVCKRGQSVFLCVCVLWSSMSKSSTRHRCWLYVSKEACVIRVV